MILAIVFVLGVVLLGWHRTHEKLRDQRRRARTLVQQNERLLDEHARERKPAPDPAFWSDDVYLRLVQDVDPHIRVGDREQHSHAESCHRKEPAGG